MYSYTHVQTYAIKVRMHLLLFDSRLGEPIIRLAQAHVLTKIIMSASTLKYYFNDSKGAGGPKVRSCH